MTKTIRWGILAPGKIAYKFAEDILKLSDNEIVAVASRSLDRANEFAENFGVKHAFGCYKSLVVCDEVDIVYIASPHSEHYAHTLLCLNAGKAVLCEKAFALTVAQVEEMTALAKKKQLFLMEAIWTRFHGATHQVLEKVNSGAIGKIVHIAADFGFKAEYHPEKRLFNPALGGGSLYDIGLYPLFITKLLLGQPSTLKATGTLAPSGVDMSCVMALSYESGATASLFSTFAAKTNTECIIYGTEGKIHIHGRFHETQQLSITQGEVTSTWATQFLGNGYIPEIQHVNQCIQSNLVESPLLPHAFSIELMQLLENTKNQLTQNL